MAKGIPKNGLNKGWFKKEHKVIGGFKKGNQSAKGNPPNKTSFKKGQPPQNKGRRYKINKVSNSKGRHYSRKTEFKKGHHYSPETEFKKGKINNPNRKFKDTDIELKVEAELKRRNINYQKQVLLCKVAIVDFYLPEYRIVIECDGDYWHNLPGRKEKDKRRDNILTFNGFNVYRFWQHEINKSVEKCINKLLIQ